MTVSRNAVCRDAATEFHADHCIDVKTACSGIS
jgi:hypothetical protein